MAGRDDERDDEIIRRVALVLERRPDCNFRLVDLPFLARWLREEGAAVDAIPDRRFGYPTCNWLDALVHRQTPALVRRLINRVAARSVAFLNPPPPFLTVIEPQQVDPGRLARVGLSGLPLDAGEFRLLSPPRSRDDEDRRYEALQCATVEACATGTRVWDPVLRTWACDEYGDLYLGAPRDLRRPFRLYVWFTWCVAHYYPKHRRRVPASVRVEATDSATVEQPITERREAIDPAAEAAKAPEPPAAPERACLTMRDSQQASPGRKVGGPRPKPGGSSS
jgi:hypothetical protein